MSEMSQNQIQDQANKILLSVDAEIINSNGGGLTLSQNDASFSCGTCYVKERLFGGPSLSGEGVKNGKRIIQLLPNELKCNLVPIYQKKENRSYDEKTTDKTIGIRGTVKISVHPTLEYVQRRLLECTQDEHFSSRLAFHSNEISLMANKVEQYCSNSSSGNVGISQHGLFYDHGDRIDPICSFRDLGLMDLPQINSRIVLTKNILKTLNNSGKESYLFSVRVFGWSSPYSLVPYFYKNRTKDEKKVSSW